MLPAFQHNLHHLAHSLLPDEAAQASAAQAPPSNLMAHVDPTGVLVRLVGNADKLIKALAA